MKIDYLYCDDPGHDKIYACATNDTHTVIMYGSRLKGSLKNSIKPRDIFLHDSTVTSKMKEHNGYSYHRTDRLDVKRKVDDVLKSIGFLTPQDNSGNPAPVYPDGTVWKDTSTGAIYNSPANRNCVISPRPAWGIKQFGALSNVNIPPNLPMFKDEPCMGIQKTDSLGNFISWELVGGAVFILAFNVDGTVKQATFTAKGEAPIVFDWKVLAPWMLPYTTVPFEAPKFISVKFTDECHNWFTDVNCSTYSKALALLPDTIESGFSQFKIKKGLKSDIPVHFMDPCDHRTEITKEISNNPYRTCVLNVYADSSSTSVRTIKILHNEPGSSYNIFLSCILFNYALCGTSNLKFTINDSVFVTCIDNTAIENSFETGMDFLLLRREGQNITLIDKFGDERVVAAYKFNNIRKLI